MWLSLLGTAFFMGLVGGPHCLAMCAAPCAAITAGPANAQIPIAVHEVQPGHTRPVKPWARGTAFHLGRLLGYGVLGGVAAYAMEQVAWFSDRTSALHPLWVGLHLLALAWGLMLLFQARQPLWLEQGGRRLWSRVQHGLRLPAGSWLAGCLWAFLPCGLLYSAVMVAALAGEVMQGGAAMVAFGLGSGLWLVAAPWVWSRLSQARQWRESWGLRVAGALLALVSIWALWMDMVHTPAQWCR